MIQDRHGSIVDTCDTEPSGHLGSIRDHIITDTYYHVHWPPVSHCRTTRGQRCLFWHNIHWSLICWDQDQSDDDSDVIRIIVMRSDTQPLGAFLTPLILTALAPARIASPLPLSTVPVSSQEQEKQFQDKILWVFRYFLANTLPKYLENGSDRLYI